MHVLQLLLAAVLTMTPLAAWTPAEVGSENDRRPRVGGLTLQARPAEAIARELVKLSGSVGAAVRRPVTLQKKRGPSWTTVQSTTSSNKGTYSFKVRTPKRGTASTYRTVAPPTKVAGRKTGKLTSPTRTVSVVPQTGELDSPSTTAVDKEWPIAATFTPARPGRTVLFQERTEDRWRTVGKAQQDATGSASAAMIGITEGTFTYRAVAKPFHGARGFRTGTREVTVGADTTQVTEVAEPLDGAESGAITSIDLAAGELRFGPDAPASLDEISPGDVVTVPPMAGAGSGALLKVTEVTMDGTDRVFRTTPATLPEVVANVPDDQTEVAMPVSGPVEIEPLEELSGEFVVEDVDGASFDVADLRRARVDGVGAASIDGKAKKISFSHTFKETKGDVTSKVDVSGSISLAPVVDFAFDADWGGVKSYTLGTGFKVTDKLKASGSVTWAKEWRHRLFRVSSVHAGAIGPVPIYVVTTGTVELVIGAAGQVSATYSWDRTGEAVVGIKGTRASGLFKPKVYNRAPVTSAELLVGNAVGALSAGVVGTGRFDIYSVAGAYAELGYEAVLNITDSSEQGLSCTLNHRPLAAVGVSTGEVVKTLTGVTYELARHDFSFPYNSISLCPAGPPPPPPPPPPADDPVITTSFLPDGTVGEPYAAELEVEDDREGTWTVDGLPDGLTVDDSTGAIRGTPTTDGANMLDVEFTDSDGLTDSAAIGLTVRPGDVSPDGSTWKRIAGAGFTTCGVQLDGTGWCWGDNSYGQVGDGTTTGRPSPTQVPGTWREILTSGKTTCGIKVDGSGWCWGLNRYGSVGIGAPPGSDPVDQHRPAQVAGSWLTIAPGTSEATCGIRTDRTGWCWGTGAYGQLGVGDQQRRDVPTQLPGAWRTILPGGGPTTCGIRTDGTGWCWGRNNSGQVGDGSTVDREAPTQLPGTWAALDRGEDTTCGVRLDGTGWCWGRNKFGQVGSGTDVDQTAPVQLPGSWAWLDADADGSCGVRTDGTGWCWGRSSRGEVGNGTTTTSLSPSQVHGSWTSIERSGWLTCGTQTDGSGWCWGMLGGSGGDQNNELVLSPGAVGGSWKGIAVHEGTVCGIQADDTGWCWGYNMYGQVGDGSRLDRYQPVQVP